MAGMAHVQGARSDQPFPDLMKRIDLTRLYPERSGYPVFVYCPRHGDVSKPNLAVYRHNTYCHACGFHEGALNHIERVKGCKSKYDVLWWAGRLAGDTLYDEEGTPQPTLPLDPSIAGQHEAMLAAHPDWYDWLKRKYGLSREGAEAAHIGHTGYAYTIPVFSLSGELLTVRYRVDPERFPNADLRYYGTRGYNKAHWFLSPAWVGVGSFSERYNEIPRQRGRFSNVVFITEGEFDALALWQCGFPTVSATNGAGALLTKEGDGLLAELREADVRAALMYDQDATGREKARKVWRRMMEAGIDASNVTWPRRLGKDGGELVARGAARHNLRQHMRVYPWRS